MFEPNWITAICAVLGLLGGLLVWFNNAIQSRMPMVDFHIKQSAYCEHIFRKQRNLLENLDDEEIGIVYAIMKNHFQPVHLSSQPVIMSLLSKDVLMHQNCLMGKNYYILTPNFKACFLNEFRKSCERKE